MSTLGKILGGVGYVLDTPGSLLRGGIANTADLLRGEDRFQGFRASGRQMLDSMGVGGGYGAGLAADLLVDPLNALGGAALLKNASKLAKGVSSGASTLGAALRPSKSTAMALGAPTAGFGVLALNEDQDPGLSLLGTALMMSPLAVGMAKGIGKLTAGKAVQQVSAPGGFRSRLEEAAEALGAKPDDIVPVYRGTDAAGAKGLKVTEGGAMGDGVYFYTSKEPAKSHVSQGGKLIVGYVNRNDPNVLIGKEHMHTIGPGMQVPAGYNTVVVRDTKSVYLPSRKKIKSKPLAQSPTPKTYLDVGHDPQGGAEMFAFLDGKLKVEPAGKQMHSDVFGPSLTEAKSAISGRIDHAKRQISVTSTGERVSDAALRAAAKRLANKYPDYDIYNFDEYFSNTPLGAERPSPRLMSMLPWLAAGGGATGSALAHALGQQQEAY